MIKITKNQYHHNKLTSMSSSLRETWSVINSIISKKQSTKKPMVMQDSNLEQITHRSNNFFVILGPSLGKKSPQTNTSYKKHLAGTYNNNLFLSPPHPKSALKSRKTKDWDGVNISLDYNN